MVAYCVVSIDPHLTGEIDLMFVSRGFRRIGIGTRLMQNAMRWMDGLWVGLRMLTVIVGNEDVHEFYARFGFMSKSIVLERLECAGKAHRAEKHIN